MSISINEDWKIKALALGCALILWFFVMGERQLEVGYTVPLELKNVPSGMVITNDFPQTVDIRLSGPRALLSSLSQRDLRLSVDLAGLKPGVTTFSRLDDHLRLPVGVRAARISPSFVDLRLERIINKSVPLRARFSGQLPGGYQLTAVDISPQKVVVEGAEGEVANLGEVLTDRIDLSEIRGSSEVTVPLDYRGKYSQIKDVKNATVRLQVKGGHREKSPPKSPDEGLL